MTAIEQPPAVRAAPANARLVAAAAFALPPVMLLVVAFGLALRGGGVAPEQWQPAAVGLSAALLILAAVGAVRSIPRAALPMLVGLAALLAWSAGSMAWSASREATFEQVIRLAMLAGAAVVGAAYASRPRAALLLGAGIALFGAAMALVVEAKLLTGSTEAFLGSRLSWPISYANADAALLWMPVPALVTFAAAQPLRPLVRGALAFCAALALTVGLTAQSRGAAIAVAGALIASVLIARDRGRFALTLLAVAVPVAAMAPQMVGGDPSVSAELVRDRGRAALFAAVGAAVLVCGLALLDRRSRIPFGGREGRVAVAAWTLVLALAAGAFLATSGRPDRWAAARWDEFTNVHSTSSAENATHFGTGVSNRYDYWRVAWRTFEDEPVGGVGAGAFSVPWFRSRSIDENVTDAHSWQAGALAETGLVGLALLGLVLLLPITRIPRARSGPGAWPIAAVALGGAAVYFVLHASLDWLLRIPAVAVPGFVVLGALASGGGEPGETVFAGLRLRATLVIASALVAAAAIPAYLSTTSVARASSESATSSEGALQELDSAARLNPFSTEPLLLQSMILQVDGDRPAALDAAKDATDREPRNWTAWVVRAQAAQTAGRPQEARAARSRAKSLNPRAVQLKR